MNVLNYADVLPALCAHRRQWGMYISCHGDQDELLKAAPYFDHRDEDFQVDLTHALIDGEAYLLFDSEAEMSRFYNRTVGDDGPTKTNPYAGPARVYACTCGPNGNLLTENT